MKSVLLFCCFILAHAQSFVCLPSKCKIVLYWPNGNIYELVHLFTTATTTTTTIVIICLILLTCRDSIHVVMHFCCYLGTEGICAGTFLPSTTCLVHGKVLKSQLDFWARSPSSLLTDSLIKLAQATFK